MAAPRQRNSREENAQIKAGQTPPGFAAKPAKLRQKDCDARWTQKHGRSYYGDKNHLSVDCRHKLVHRYAASDAARHDSQELEAVLNPDKTASDVWADSAYRSTEIEAKLTERGQRNGTMRKRVFFTPPLPDRPLFERWCPGLANDNPASAGEAAAAA